MKAIVSLAAVVLLALAAASWRREKAWRSTFALFSDALAVDEQNWKAQDIVGSELVKRGDDAAALRHFQRSAELNPQDPIVWVNTGAVLRRYGKTDQAVTLFRKATEMAPESAVSHQWLGLGLSIERDYAGADREFTEAIRLGPDDPTIPAFWASSMAARGRFDRARQLAQSALNIDPTNPTALHTMENIDRLDASRRK
jgi:Flp pilus assembly protein TadD